MPSDLVEYVYIIGPAEGPVKVGKSEAPETRIKQLQAKTNEVLYLMGKWPLGRAHSLAVERYVHWLLRDKAIGREWFDVTREEAAHAIDTAISRDIHPDYPMPELDERMSEMKGGAFVRAKLPAGMIDRVHRASNGQHAAFVREAIENELARRASA